MNASPEPWRPDVKPTHTKFLTGPDFDPTRLVSIDETWVKTNMTRMRGWSLRGTPLLATVPYGHWKRLTFLAGLRHDRIVAPFVLDGPINATSFAA